MNAILISTLGIEEAGDRDWWELLTQEVVEHKLPLCKWGYILDYSEAAEQLGYWHAKENDWQKDSDKEDSDVKTAHELVLIWLSDLGKFSDQVNLVVIDWDIVRAAWQTNLVSQFICCLLVLALYFDGQNYFFESTPIIQESYRQEEEAKSIYATHNAVESWQPRRIVNHIRSRRIRRRFLRQYESQERDDVSGVGEDVANDEQRLEQVGFLVLVWESAGNVPILIAVTPARVL